MDALHSLFSSYLPALSLYVFLQELLVYLGIFVRTEPSLFKEMLRLRVGLIIEVMVAELARSLDCSGKNRETCKSWMFLIHAILNEERLGVENYRVSKSRSVHTDDFVIFASSTRLALSESKLK